MARIREIATKFKLTGIEGTKNFMKKMGAAIWSGFKTAAGAPVWFAKKTAHALKTISFKAFTASWKLAVGGLGLSLTGLVAKFGALSAAAKSFANDFAERMQKLRTISKATGESVQDIAVLREAAKQNGGDAEEILPTLSEIAQNFGDIKNAIEEADAAYEKTKNWSRTGFLGAISLNDMEGAKGFIEQAAQARQTSLKGIAERKAAIWQEGQDSRVGGKKYNEYIRAGYSEKQTQEEMGKRVLALVKEFKELEAAEKSIKDGFGPVGEAMEELKEYGLDMDEAMKGGVHTLRALGDALNKIPDSSKKLAIAGKLFGGDAGAKNLALLEGGSANLDKYKKQLESVGALPTDADAELGSDLKRSQGRVEAAWDGLKNIIGREVSPLMIQTNDKIVEWLGRNSQMITSVVKNAFVAVNKVFMDVLKFIEGSKDFESSIFKKGAAIFKWVIDSFLYVRDLLVGMWVEFSKAFDGMDTQWDWLDYLVEKFKDIKDWALSVWNDIMAIWSGKDAVRFEWMNEVRDGFKKFKEDFLAAWGAFKEILDSIHAMIRPILELFNTNVMQAALFIGLLRISGLFGVGVAGGGLFIKGIKKAGELFKAFFSGITTGAPGAVSKLTDLAKAAGVLITGPAGLVAAGVAAFGAGVAYLVNDSLEKMDAKLQASLDRTASKIRAMDQEYLLRKLDTARGQGTQAYVNELAAQGRYTGGRRSDAQAVAGAKAEILKRAGFNPNAEYEQSTINKALLEFIRDRENNVNYTRNIFARTPEEKQAESDIAQALPTLKLELSVGGQKVNTYTSQSELDKLNGGIRRAQRMGN